MFEIVFQNNQRPHDYVYEISTVYLLSRCLHLAVQLKLFEKISDKGVLFDELLGKLPDYEKEALRTLLNVLNAYRFVTITTENIIIATPLLSALQPNDEVSIEQWNASYNIVDQMERFEALHDPRVKIIVHRHQLILQADSARALIDELKHLHLVAMSLRYATKVNLFTKLCENQGTCKLSDITQLLPLKMLRLLSRYQLLTLNEEKQIICANEYSRCLFTNTEGSLYFAMLMITQEWWNAAGRLISSFQKGLPSAFEKANEGKTFMSLFYNSPEYKSTFNSGMAAISFFEDKDVAEASLQHIKDFPTVIDIGGGEAGLLANLFQHDATKKYLLFEKTPDDPTQVDATAARLHETITHNYNRTFNAQIILGDFYHGPEYNGIPKLNNTAYFVKCVLHNCKPEQINTILRNIRFAMRENCQLFLAERVIPQNHTGPHINLLGNVLMLMLFRANAYNTEFYKTALNNAGFNCDNVTSAGNYLLFVSSEKPELRFQKNTSASSVTPLSLLSPPQPMSSSSSTPMPKISQQSISHHSQPPPFHQ